MTGNPWIQRSQLAALVAVLIAGLIAGHAVILHQVEYQGYDFHIYSPSLLIMAIGAALAPTAYMPLRSDRPSLLAYYLLYFLVYVPTCIVPCCMAEIRAEGFGLFLVVFAGSFWLLGQVYDLPMVEIPRLTLSRDVFWLFILSIFGIAWLIVVRNYGFHVRWVSFDDVYDVRAEYQDILEQQSRVLAYLVPWLTNVIAPFAFVFFIRRRRWSLVALVGLSQFLIYTITAYKHVLFSVALLIGLAAALQWKRGPLVTRLALGCLGLVMACGALDLATGDHRWTTFGTRRMFLNNGLLTGFYFDFFSVNPKACLAHGVLRHFLTYPYSASPPLLIGETYFGPECHANAHVWADAFANFGLPGVVGFTLGLGAFLWVYDCVARGANLMLASLVLAVPSIALANTALLTSILTHGLGLALALMAMAPQNYVSRTEEAKPRRTGPLPAPARSALGVKS